MPPRSTGPTDAVRRTSRTAPAGRLASAARTSSPVGETNAATGSVRPVQAVSAAAPAALNPLRSRVRRSIVGMWEFTSQSRDGAPGGPDGSNRPARGRWSEPVEDLLELGDLVGLGLLDRCGECL